MAKLSNKKLLAIALTLSLVTTVLVYNYLKGAADKQSTQEGVSVIVAKVDILPKTRITPDMVQEIKVPVEYVQPGAVQELRIAVGAIAREQIAAHEQIIERRLIVQGKAVGFTGAIPPDKRAITVAVTEVTGVAGFIKPGDYVDVIVTFDAGAVGDHVSNVMLQNVLVLAVNRDPEVGVNETSATGKDIPKEAIKTTTVTVAVSPDEAAKLTLAEEKGKIHMALRPYLPANGFVLTGTTTPKDIVGIHISPVKSKAADEQTPAAAPVTTPAYTPYYPPPTSSREKATTIDANLADSKGIQMIRGTKVEQVHVN